MHLLLAYSLPRNLTVKASVSVVTTYYICTSDAGVVSVIISAETETSSNCRRCLAMDVRVDSYNQPLSGTPQYYIYTFLCNFYSNFNSNFILIILTYGLTVIQIMYMNLQDTVWINIALKCNSRTNACIICLMMTQCKGRNM
jgi:hypothetical protein